MSTPTSLIQLPKVPMEHIMEYLDFPSILVLRKVCHDLRNFIDDTKPASRTMEIYVQVNADNIYFDLKLRTLLGDTNNIHIKYKKNGDGCFIKYLNVDDVKRQILDDRDFITVFCKDFDRVLRHQKTVLEEFRVTFNSSKSTVKRRILESFNESLNSMIHPLQAKKFDVEMSNHEEILSVLPYIDSKSLEEIAIRDPLRSQNMLNLDEIGQLDQWKQADKLSIIGFQITDPVKNLKHFSKISLDSPDVSTEKIRSLKEIIFCSPTLTTMEIYYNFNTNYILRQGLIETFGEPYKLDSWFFRILDTNQFLKLKLDYSYINFNRIEQSDVPQDVIVQN